MAIDLLVFGPHPDDLEIGLGGTIARYAALNLRVGLCDLTTGEMGSNGTPEERVAEGEAARAALGAAWREHLRWQDRRIGKDPAHLDEAVAFIRRHQPRTIAVPYWSDRHPDHAAASQVLTEAVFNAGLRRYPGEGEAWKPDWICFYFINDSTAPSFLVDVSEHYERKRAALDCHATQFQRGNPHRDPAEHAALPAAVESRDAQFARWPVLWAEGVWSASPSRAEPHAASLTTERPFGIPSMNTVNIAFCVTRRSAGAGLSPPSSKVLAARHRVTSSAATPPLAWGLQPGLHSTGSRRRATRCFVSRSFAVVDEQDRAGLAR
jgi:bacillithiol biosynthesis deacetylase BshB1